MMRTQHATSKRLRRLFRDLLSITRHVSVITTLLTLLWIYIVYGSERTTFHSHISACEWSKWEQWPPEASPHHLVFIADPQLVDPHTYPGRPWPLSKSTERYTDMYMARNFRLINAHLDPDSIVFLGDLLDGGREWATPKSPPLTADQRAILEAWHVGGAGKATLDVEVDGGVEEAESMAGKEKRSLDNDNMALGQHHDHLVDMKERSLDKHDNDLKDFQYGEGGKWWNYGQRQWDSEFDRFGRIFFDTQQLYPEYSRALSAAWEIDPLDIDSGRRDVAKQRPSFAEGTQRRLITSLPGNHDVGFGDGVQWAVRDRFHSHFGESNRVDIIANHTFVSIDTPSLSAYSQFLREGGETLPESRAEMEPIWRPPMDFLNIIRPATEKAAVKALSDYFPHDHPPKRGWAHEVTHPRNLGLQLSQDEVEADIARQKPRLPIVLLTHMPLYRNADTDCGPLRERGHSIAISAGYQYQNVVTRDLSNMIMHNVSAAGDVAHIFSGDDHDYCDVEHRYNVADASGSALSVQSVREITVKSFSWAMGVRRPGFLLVSMWNPVDAMGKTIGMSQPTIQTHLCLLPDQLSIFISYLRLLLFTCVILLIRAIILAVRNKTTTDSEDSIISSPVSLVLPRFKAEPSTSNGIANGYADSPQRSSSAHSRQRASSTSTSTNSNAHNTSTYLGVQRTYTARTRSVSPAAAAPGALPDRWMSVKSSLGPLNEKAGYYPPVRGPDPTDESEDEEQRVGSHYEGEEEEDGHAKWKRRRRVPGLLQRFAHILGRSMALVGVPAVVWYWWLIRSG